jgi:hypothetical protein
MYSVKRGQICAFYACNAKLMFAIAEKAYNYNPDQPYLKAMYAFALGEVRKTNYYKISVLIFHGRPEK